MGDKKRIMIEREEKSFLTVALFGRDIFQKHIIELSAFSIC
jgi:hypothetical protein